MTHTPVLEREEYVEQAYFFQVMADRLMEGAAAQEVLRQIHEEILTTTRLPYAIQFLDTELKHTGLLGPGMQRLSHYFTPFQAFVIGKAEADKHRFGIQSALQALESEARYRAENPTRQGLFLFQFEVMSRCRLGYTEGLTAMAGDAFYNDPWRDYMELVRRSMGEVEFADLVYVRSELYAADQAKLGKTEAIPESLFGLKEGRIAKANRGRDPLYLFAALQRQLGYPAPPRAKPKDETGLQLKAIQVKLAEMENRLRLIEGETRGQIDIIQKLGKPEILRDEEDA
jgi:hypothetical protein